MVEETYESISSTQGKSAHFFAEKSPLQEPVRQACRTLFSNVKEIVLVRDPRDYLCSATKFWAHDVGEAMATQATELPVIMKIFNDRRNDVLFVRYEDVVLDAVSARKRIYDFIGCDATFQPHQVDPDVIPEAHRTSASPADSVGRFRTELDDRTLRACQDSFGSFMKMFDYKY